MYSHLKPGDPVVVLDVNHPARRKTVENVGRKYISVKGEYQAKFDLHTGVEKSTPGYGTNRSIVTVEQHESALKVEQARKELLDFGVELSYRMSMPAAKILAIRAALDGLMRTQ